jgi:uncharacterized protein YsxB (DUF464 family)
MNITKITLRGHTAFFEDGTNMDNVCVEMFQRAHTMMALLRELVGVDGDYDEDSLGRRICRHCRTAPVVHKVWCDNPDCPSYRARTLLDVIQKAMDPTEALMESMRAHMEELMQLNEEDIDIQAYKRQVGRIIKNMATDVDEAPDLP